MECHPQVVAVLFVGTAKDFWAPNVAYSTSLEGTYSFLNILYVCVLLVQVYSLHIEWLEAVKVHSICFERLRKSMKISMKIVSLWARI
jgi:hypothetical protein